MVENETGFLTAPSNRRSKGENIPLDIKWSIDRITVVGTLRSFLPNASEKSDSSMARKNATRINVEDVFNNFVDNGHARQAGSGFQILADDEENIAYFERVKFDKSKGRLDFNPNKLSSVIQNGLKDFIQSIFLDSHFSRCDVAADIYNLPDNYVNTYRVNEPIGSQFFFGKSGKLETAYFGARSSERQVRLYNKKIERIEKKHIEEVKDVDTWWRLELQLRRGSVDDFKKRVQDTLANFYSPHSIPETVSPIERAVLIGLYSEPDNWGRLDKKTRSKYRALCADIASDDFLTTKLVQSFDSQKNEIEKELKDWLSFYSVG